MKTLFAPSQILIHWRPALVCAAFSLLFIPTFARSDDQDFKISTQVNLVLLDVSVRDPKGGFVTGLEKESFHVTENGRPQTITSFANKDIPVTVGLVVDNSGSMKPKHQAVVLSAIHLIQASNPKDEVFVVNFNDRVQRGLPDKMLFTDNIEILRRALSKSVPAGRTALYDALALALKHLEYGREDKKTIVLISDGGDNVSTLKMPELSRMVEESRATIYTIGLFESDDPDANPGVLRKFSNISGGVSYLPKELTEVPEICKQIAKEIRTRYTIAYIPTSSDRKGSRSIKVIVNDPERGKLIAHTRTSYRMPEQK